MHIKRSGSTCFKVEPGDASEKVEHVTSVENCYCRGYMETCFWNSITTSFPPESSNVSMYILELTLQQGEWNVNDAQQQTGLKLNMRKHQ